MDYNREFIIQAKNNLPLKEYVRKISHAFKEGAIFSEHIFGTSKLENDDFIVLNQRILKRDFYLDINFILGSHRQYLKIDCDVFAETEEEITETRNKLEGICGVENA